MFVQYNLTGIILKSNLSHTHTHTHTHTLRASIPRGTLATSNGCSAGTGRWEGRTERDRGLCEQLVTCDPTHHPTDLLFALTRGQERKKGQPLCPSTSVPRLPDVLSPVYQLLTNSPPAPAGSHEPKTLRKSPRPSSATNDPATALLPLQRPRPLAKGLLLDSLPEVCYF